MSTSLTDAGAGGWQQVRKTVLARDGGVCCVCGNTPQAGELDIHHLIPRAAGGLDDPANLITLCDGCHATRHPNLHASLARRTIERWGIRLARWLDRQNELQSMESSLGAALRVLGVERFRPPQLEIVLAALRGESLLFVSATGSGKSLCFQIPVLLSQGVGVVISPLRALMSQQVESLQKHHIPSSFINGDLSPEEKALRYDLLRQGVIKFLYCTPERFDQTAVRAQEIAALAKLRPSYLVIDEAHCIDRWGNDFRPNYGRLGCVRELFGNPPVLAFTATAGAESQKRILGSLGIPEARVIVTGVNRPNIAFARLAVGSDQDRLDLIADLLRAMSRGRAMIFVPTVRIGRRVQNGLRELGCELPFFHSRMGTANERDMLLGQFTGRLEPQADKIICTNAFGMGLDVPDVRLVIHWQHPASVEDYLQEFGRAGRDGSPAIAVLFTSPNDEGLLRYMAQKTVKNSRQNDPAVLTEKYRSIAVMHRHATRSRKCFRKAIVDYFGDARSATTQSLSRRIIAWLFEEKTTVSGSQYCCDSCDGVDARNVRRWALYVWTDQKRGWKTRHSRRQNRSDEVTQPQRRFRFR